MAAHDFFSETTRRRVREAIERAEARTSAEVVVALRRRSASTMGPALLFGAASAFVALLALLLLPRPFASSAFVVDVVVAFAFAAWSTRLSPSLVRALLPRDEALSAVRHAAAAEFLRREVHRCKGRNGVLVYVSMLERRVEVLGDLGIDHQTLDQARAQANAALEAGDVEAFALALEALGAALAEKHPRAEDDVDELPNEPSAA